MCLGKWGPVAGETSWSFTNWRAEDMGTIAERDEEHGEEVGVILHHREEIAFHVTLSRTDVGVSQIDSNAK